MTISNSKAFLTESEPRLLLRNSLPMFGAILALFSYELFESTLIAMQDASTLAAFGFTLPITAAMMALAIGLSVRSNNKAVQCNCLTPQQLPAQIVHSLLCTFVIVALFSFGFYLFHEQLILVTGFANWLDASESSAAATYQTQYMHWRYAGWIALALFWQVNAILRAQGWMKLASNLMLVWIAIKTALAFLLLAPTSPLQWSDFSGLGLVHLIADTCFALISIVVLHRRVPLKFSRDVIQRRRDSIPTKDSLLVIAQQFITPISMLCLTAFAASLDTSYVAALALLFRLEVLFLLLPMVLTTSMPAIVGANFWTGQKDRVKRLYWYGLGAIAVFQLFIAVVAYSQQHLISMFVCPHEDIAIHIRSYLNWVPWGYAAAGAAIVLQSCLNAKNYTFRATLIGLCHRLLLVLPLTILGGIWYGYEGFYQGMMLGHVGAILAVIYVLRRLTTKLNTTKHTPPSTILERVK